MGQTNKGVRRVHAPWTPAGRARQKHAPDVLPDCVSEDQSLMEGPPLLVHIHIPNDGHVCRRDTMAIKGLGRRMGFTPLQSGHRFAFKFHGLFARHTS
jgi:hypothetical protein